MVNIIIRSDEQNAFTTALSLAAKHHKVCLLSEKSTPGPYEFSYFGKQRSVTLHSISELDPDHSVGMVFAEGESVRAGVDNLFAVSNPDLVLLIGGGVTGAIEAIESVQRFSYSPAHVLHVGAFLVGGDAGAVRSEKKEVLAGFLGRGTLHEVIELAQSTFPALTIGNASAVALSSINALFHVPPMLLNAMSVERGDNIRFYVEGFGDSVIRLLLALDADRLKIGSALGLELLPVQTLKSRYSGSGGQHQRLSLREQINTQSSQTASLPSNFQHRFLRHELHSSFAPMAEIANALDIDTPTLRSVVKIGEILLDEDLQSHARTAARAFLDLTTVTSPAL